MAIAKKDLTTVGDILELNIPHEKAGMVSIQVGSGAVAGTALVEITVNGSDWVGVIVTNETSGAAVPAATGLTAAGVYSFDMKGFESVRVRKSASAGAFPVALSVLER